MTLTASKTNLDQLCIARDHLKGALDLLAGYDPDDVFDVDPHDEFEEVLEELDDAIYWALDPDDRLPFLAESVFVWRTTGGALWYSNRYFAKPVDGPAMRLFANAGITVEPGSYRVVRSGGGGDVDQTSTSNPGDAFAEFQAGTPVALEHEMVDGERITRQVSPGLPRLRAYLLRRPDDQPVLLDIRYVDWIEQHETIASCTQAAHNPLGPVTLRDTAGEARGFIMPIKVR